MIRKQMKSELLQAMKAGRKADVTTLRTLIAAIDNAEAVPLDETHTIPVNFNGRNEDVPRLHLTPEDIQQILQREADERREAMAEYERLGRLEQAEILKASIALIERYVD